MDTAVKPRSPETRETDFIGVGNSCIDAVIFDFDGTLANTVDLNFSVYNELALKYRLNQITKEDLCALKEKSTQEILSALGVSKFMAAFVIADGRRRITKYIKSLRIDPGIASLVRQVHSQLKVGIVSTNSRKNIEYFLQYNDLHDYDFIVGSVGLLGKRHALSKIIKKQNLRPGHVLYVGDEIRDIIAARACGLIAVSVSWGYNSMQALSAHQPDYLVESPKEFLSILKKLLSLPP